MSRRVHWTTQERVEDLAASSDYPIEFGRDVDGDYAAVITREGTEFRARLAAAYRELTAVKSA